MYDLIEEQDERTSQQLVELTIKTHEAKLNRVVYNNDKSFYTECNFDLEGKL